MLSTDDKRFIIQSVENGYKVSDLARMFNVTPRRVQQILKEDINEEHTKKRYSSLTDEDVSEIENLWNNYKVGSRTIFYLLKSRDRRTYSLYSHGSCGSCCGICPDTHRRYTATKKGYDHRTGIII